MKSYVGRLFADAERRSERGTAYFRLAVFVVLLLAHVLLPATQGSWLVTASLGGYGALTGAGLWFAHRRYFRVWLPWAFATAEVLLLLNFVAVLVNGLAIPLDRALGGASVWMIFTFLGIAAMRFRPSLVVYTALLFGGGIVAIALGARPPASIPGADASPVEQAGLAGVAVRLSIVGLTAAALAVMVARARRLLVASIVEARRRANLGRYFPSNLVDSLSREGADIVQRTRRQNVAVLFADIVGFTAMSERLDAESVVDILNEFRRLVSAPVLAHGGTLDKYIGDAVMAVFGTPEPAGDDALRAVACACDMAAALDAWAAERIAAGEVPVRIGIGIDYGEVVAGALGDESRLEYTVVGNTVNTAERIERLTRGTGERIIVSAGVIEAIGVGRHDFAWEAMPPQTLPGRSVPVRVYRILPAAVGGMSAA